MLLVDCPHHFQTPLDIPFVHKERLILTVIVLVLPVRHRAVISDLVVLPLRDNAGSRAVDDRLQPHPAEILYGDADHFLKAEAVTDIHYRLFRQILACIDKSDAVAFRVHIRHLLKRLLRQTAQMMRRAQLILRDILTEPVEIAVIVQIRIFYDIGCKGIRRIDLFLDPVRKEYVAVVACIPVNDIPDLF